MKKFFTKKRNVAAILSAFTTMVDDLSAIAVRELAHKEEVGKQVDALLDQMNEHHLEAARATKAASKIAALIDG